MRDRGVEVEVEDLQPHPQFKKALIPDDGHHTGPSARPAEIMFAAAVCSYSHDRVTFQTLQQTI